MRTRLLSLGLLAAWWWTGSAQAQDDPAPTPEIRAPEGGGGIIPDPREGRAPETPGDPGGWQQLTLLLLIVVALIAIGLLVRRQIRQGARLRDIDTTGSGEDTGPS